MTKTVLLAGVLALAAGAVEAQEVTLKAVTSFAEKTQFSKNFERFIDKVNADLVKALGTQNVKSRLGELGVDVISSTPEQFGAFMASEALRWGKLIKDAGIQRE